MSSNWKKEYNIFDKKATAWMKKEGTCLLRYSLGLVFIWFGILKPFNLSPAQDLVANTVYWVSPTWFVPFLGWWEVIIGLCFLYRPLVRLAIGLMAVQMIGTFLPLLLLPEVVYGHYPFTLTLEGQYIIKNLVLICAALVVGSHVRDRKHSKHF